MVCPAAAVPAPNVRTGMTDRPVHLFQTTGAPRVGILRPANESWKLERVVTMHILGLCGSLRQHSYNRRLLSAAAMELPDGTAFVMFEDAGRIPPYNEDVEARDAPEAVLALRAAIAAADGILIATPEYNASVPGWLKNAIDWASRPYPDHVLRGKPVVVAGASTAAHGATLAQAELRRVLRAIGAHVLDARVAVAHAREAFAADGGLANARLRSELASLVRALVASVRTLEAAGDFTVVTSAPSR